MMASAWHAAVLPWLNVGAVALGWWKFLDSPFHVLGVPLSLYWSWVILWGVCATLVCTGDWLNKKACDKSKIQKRAVTRWAIRGRRSECIKLGSTVLIFFLLDILTMPRMSPVLELHSWWWLGEVSLLLFALLPGLLLGQLCFDDRAPAIRASLISLAFVVLVLSILPMAGEDVSMSDLKASVELVLRGDTSPARVFFLILTLVLAIPGMAAVRQFVLEGQGTPIPFDPPRRIVTHGVYAYIANPMQFSMFSVLLCWAWIWQSWICLALAVVSVVYAQGIATWSERGDLIERYGEKWLQYQKLVPRWRFRLLPYRGFPPRTEQKVNEDADEAVLYIAKSCSICREISAWFHRQCLSDMRLEAAESFVGEPLERMTYINARSGVRASGVEAMACAFQHLHLAWAFLGWVMQLPGLMQALQLAMDASGAGKMSCDRTCKW